LFYYFFHSWILSMLHRYNIVWSTCQISLHDFIIIISPVWARKVRIFFFFSVWNWIQETGCGKLSEFEIDYLSKNSQYFHFFELIITREGSSASCCSKQLSVKSTSRQMLRNITSIYCCIAAWHPPITTTPPKLPTDIKPSPRSPYLNIMLPISNCTILHHPLLKIFPNCSLLTCLHQFFSGLYWNSVPIFFLKKVVGLLETWCLPKHLAKFKKLVN
jgi:hypothetical protein